MNNTSYKKKMKRILIYTALMVLMFGMIAGCGEKNVDEKDINLKNSVQSKESEETRDVIKNKVESNKDEQEGVSVSKITDDVAKQSELMAQNIDIDDLSIIKRQTNIEDKEDIIYVHVEGQNADYKVIRNYKLLYVLYNEGWILDSSELYADENNKNENTPIHGVDRESIENTVKAYDFRKYDFDIVAIEESDIEAIEQDIYREVYKKVLTYEYEYFSECVEMFIICDWVDTSWLINVEYNSGLSLNESVFGTYGTSGYNQMFNTSRTINAYIYENDGIAYYSVNCVTTDVWGTTNESDQGACELKYRNIGNSMSYAGISGTCVILNTEEDFTLAIFPEGIYYGNSLLDKQ